MKCNGLCSVCKNHKIVFETKSETEEKELPVEYEVKKTITGKLIGRSKNANIKLIDK